MEEGVIKKGPNIYLYYWTLAALGLFIVLNYFSRNLQVETLNISLLTSVVTFLFGFLISISFSMLLARTASLRDSLAIETGRLISLYHLSKNLGDKFHSYIEEKIDEYTIKTLRDYTRYEVGRDSIYEIYNNIEKAEVKNNFQISSMNSFLYILGEFEPTREKLESLTGRKLLWSLKLADYLLGFILIILLFLNRGDTFTNVIFIILSTIIIFILLIIEDYDNLRIGAYSLNISDSEQIFDLIGRERYYPKNIIHMANLEKGRSYRIGIYDPKEKTEKIFRLKYSPGFEINLNNLIKKISIKEKVK